MPPASAAALPPQFDASQFNPALMWTEYVNRLLGVTVGFLIFATAISAWRHHRHQAKILWPTIVAFLLVGYEGWLGGRVVAHELAPWIVTAHLIVAIVIVQLLLYATFQAMSRTASGGVDARLAAAAAGLIALTLLQAAIGTQVRGSIDDAMDAGIARNAALATVGRLDFLHRDLAFVTLMAAIAIVLWMLSTRSPLLTWSVAILGLAIAQIALGVFMAYGALLPAAQVGHLTLASLLLGAETVLWLHSRRPDV